MIRVQSLVKSYGPFKVLDGMTLHVRKGEVAALVGPSGGGKSTLLRCINRLESWEAGEIAVGGRTDLHERELRLHVGMVFQQFHLFPHMTALENVASGPRFVLGKPRKEAEAEGLSLLEKVGLREKAGSRPSHLSGGQQQRVAIARALAVKPEAILFDEPTSALDPAMAAEVMAVIADLASAGQTMMVVTHDMDFARKAHTVHLLAGGRVAESGPPGRVLESPATEAGRAFLRG